MCIAVVCVEAGFSQIWSQLCFIKLSVLDVLVMMFEIYGDQDSDL